MTLSIRVENQQQQASRRGLKIDFAAADTFFSFIWWNFLSLSFRFQMIELSIDLINSNSWKNNFKVWLCSGQFQQAFPDLDSFHLMLPETLATTLNSSDKINDSFEAT